MIDGVLRLDLRAHVPDLADAETANAVTRLARGGALTPGAARSPLASFRSWPLVRHSTAGYADVAVDWALAHGLSAYDAFDAVLADALDAPLVTADRLLASRARRAVLVA